MKTVIDELISAGSWTSSDASKITIGTTDLAEYTANDNATSVMIHFLANSSGAYADLTLSSAVDVTDYNEIVMSLYSAWYPQVGLDYNDVDDYNYAIDFNGTMTDYLMPTFNALSQLTFNISSETSVTRIRITSRTNNEDYLVISHCVAVTDEIPRDIFQGVKDRLETIINSKYGTTYLAGTVTGTAGDTSIKIVGNRDYIDKYAVVKITDGSNTEYHQLMDNNETEYDLGGMYDGYTLANTFAGASVYLFIPVEYGLSEREIIMPCIAVYGMAPTPIRRGGQIENVYDSYKTDGTISERRDDQIYEYNIELSCEARHDDMIAIMSECVRNMISKEYLWVNGKEYHIYFLNNPVYIDSVTGYNNMPKMQYSLRIEIKETVWDRTSLPETTDITVSYNIDT